jgi:exosortase
MSIPTSNTPFPVLTLAALAGLLGWAYFPTLEFLIGKWAGDPQYSHGFLVPVFSAFLLYRNGDAAGPWVSRPLPVAGGAVLALAFAMRAAGGGLLFHQLDAASLLVALAGIALAFGGARLARRVGPAILFLVFAFPLPFELERDVGGPLKTVATYASTFLLQTCGLPAIAEGNVILIDEVRLGVVDACSGLKMLMTFAAFSVGAVLLARRTVFEKLMVLLGIVPIALLTNVLRITATGISLTVSPDKATAAFLHDLHGWLMMPAGLALLALELWVLGRLVVRPNN